MSALTRSRFAISIGLCAATLLIALALSPGMGTQPLSVGDGWRAILSGDHETTEYAIAYRIRLPRAVKAMLAGGTLALCGAVFQTVFRNPLATPFTLGISSGGSLGALIAIHLGLTGSLLFLSFTTLCSFVGAAGVVVVIALLARTLRGLSSNSLLLGGVTIGFFCSAAMMFVMSIAQQRDTTVMVRWMMGSLDTFGLGEPLSLLPILIPACLPMLFLAGSLNQYEIGEEVASSRGVDPTRLQILCITLGSLATATIVSVCGPVGFVGLIVPHDARRIFGADNRIALPASALLGGTFLIVCDWISRVGPHHVGQWLGKDYTIHLPIGVITAMLGAPMFLAILPRRLR